MNGPPPDPAVFGPDPAGLEDAPPYAGAVLGLEDRCRTERDRQAAILTRRRAEAAAEHARQRAALFTPAELEAAGAMPPGAVAELEQARTALGPALTADGWLSGLRRVLSI
jgi:hypothetical protein